MTKCTLEDVVSALRIYLGNSNDGQCSVAGDTTLTELGIDSFGLLELVVFLEGRFGTKFPLHQLRTADLVTLQDLAQAYFVALLKAITPSSAGV